MGDLAARATKRALLCMAALLVVAVVRLLLTVASHQAVLPLIPARRTRHPHPRLAVRTGAAVGAAARWVPGASCLTQALVAQYLLAVRGYASDLRIGVKTGANGALEAHAWLMSGTVAVVGGTPEEISSYVPLTDLTPRTR